MAAEALMEIFLTCDRNHDEVVRKRMLHDFVRRNFGDNEEVLSKMEQIDEEGDITMDEFCKLFRIDPNNCRSQRFKYADDKSHISNDVQLITFDDAMTPDRLVFVSDTMIEAMNNKANPKEAAKYVKQTLDKQYNRLWHVIVIKGQYWSYYSHEPGWSVAFKYGSHIFLVWRTPGY